MSRSGRLVGAFAAILACASGHAESFYVTDQLVVTLSSLPQDSAERIGSLHSGDRVELIERHAPYARVRTPTGIEGWVKASYLNAQEPLQLRFEAQSRELESLKAQLAQLASAAAAARAPSTPPPERRSVMPAPDPPSTQAHTRLPRFGALGGAIAFFLVGLIAGLALGWRMLDRRIRRKYGGLRIY